MAQPGFGKTKIRVSVVPETEDEFELDFLNWQMAFPRREEA
jgi:hypothetical protein